MTVFRLHFGAINQLVFHSNLPPDTKSQVAKELARQISHPGRPIVSFAVGGDFFALNDSRSPDASIYESYEEAARDGAIIHVLNRDTPEQEAELPPALP